MSEGHSLLGASSMYRWSVCPGSVRQSKGKPNVSSKYADEGTAAHEIAAAVLLGAKWPDSCSEEMREFLKLYVDTVTEEYLYTGASFTKTTSGTVVNFPNESASEDKLLIEHKFDLEKLYPGCFGTADAVTWHSKIKLLRIYDLKYGKGHAVEVEDNSQLLYYALGALLTLNLPAQWVEMVVVQPRCKHKAGPVRRWRVPSVDLLEFAASLVEGAKATEDPNAPLVTGSHCFFCLGSIDCPAILAKRIEKAKAAFSNFDEVVDPFS